MHDRSVPHPPLPPDLSIRGRGSVNQEWRTGSTAR
jgi:hypothetical protein